MTSDTVRAEIGRCLAAGGLVMAILLGALWHRLSIEGRLIIGVSGFLIYVPYLAGTFWPCSGWFAPVARRFTTSEKEVWITLDDGPHPELTLQTLDVLSRHNARATFFVIGRKAADNPELLSAIVAAGHSLENHTHTHPSRTFWFMPRWWVARDVDHCIQAIEAATRKTPRLFRPPVGMVSPAAGSVAGERSLTVIGWSARGLDARSGSPESIARRVLRKVRSGGIILLHPERRIESVEALDLVLKELKQRGYRCVIPDPGQLS